MSPLLFFIPSLMLRQFLAERILSSGPITAAEFIDHSLYHAQFGYYARAAQRSGRDGDFFTSVDVGPIFGELLARQFAEMWRLMRPLPDRFDLVEAGAGNGRLARDILDAAAAIDPPFFDVLTLHLVERSPAARHAQLETLGPHRAKLKSQGESIPRAVVGVIFANELLDALPPHVVVQRHGGLREVFIGLRGDAFVEIEAEPSTPALDAYLRQAGITLRPGSRAEVNLAATAWVSDAASALAHGFLVLIDYGHEARELYSPSHAGGTLTTYTRHLVDAPAPAPANRVERTGSPEGDGATGTPSRLNAILHDPGERDITSHVDLTTVRRVAEDAGLTTVAVLDQTYFVLGLCGAELSDASADAMTLRRRMSLKTLLLPGGLGSIQKVMIFGRRVGAPALSCCSFRVRLT